MGRIYPQVQVFYIVTKRKVRYHEHSDSLPPRIVASERATVCARGPAVPEAGNPESLAVLQPEVGGKVASYTLVVVPA